MALLMKEIVTADERAEFAGDVQLEWYPADPRNARLAAGYIFTGKAIAKYLSSIDLLDKLRMSFTWEREPNKYVVVATYGHGKSHLALALANFFGKPLECGEVQGFLDKIAHAAPDGAVAQNFRDFKASRPPYLVIRLRGDVAKGLHEQFLLGLERALQEHDATKGTNLPFWYEPAEEFLKDLSDDDLASANEFLSGHQLDVPSLLDAVEKRDATRYSLCRQLFKHIHKTLPDFGGEVNLEDALIWATDEFCGEGKPLSGVLILFDEFSAFIQSYAAKHRGGAPLQDLLNGVANRRGRALFVAFSQHDPDTAAENAYRRIGHDGGRDDIRKELERLPKSARFNLYSSLETVLDSYLRQDDAAWEQLLDSDGVLQCVEDATDSTMRLFSERYDDRLGWGTERVDQVITKGCFPLHPISTALLCSVQFREVVAPRSVLGFVLTKLKEKGDQPAIIDDRPNWVYPVELVDWFDEMLADTAYEQYESACQQAGPECPEVHRAVLKAMLLYSVAQLKPSVMAYPKVISLLTGRPQDECRMALERLHADGYIRRDETNKTYAFWPVGGGSVEVERKLKEQVQRMQLGWNELCTVNRDWAKTKRLAPIPVECDYGHSEDWAATQILLTREFYDSEHLKHVVSKFRATRNGLADAPRGFVIRLIADSDDDVAWFEANAESVLDGSLDDDAPPVVVVVPSETLPGLRNQIIREYVLDSWTSDLRREFGTEAYYDTEKRIDTEIDEAMERLRDASDYAVPKQYRAYLRALGYEQNSRNLRWILKTSYGAAYSSTPTFFSQYKSDKTALRTAVGLLCGYLAGNALASNSRSIHANPVAADLLDKFLQVGSEAKWAIVTYDDRVCVPQSSKVQSAWKLLDDSFAPEKGEVQTSTPLLRLLNPPYGYDYNQLALLFCAWYGFNRHYLQMSRDGRFCSIDDFLKHLQKARDFVAQLCYVSDVRISRSDRDAAARDIANLVDRANKEEFTSGDAENAQRRLLQYCGEEENDPDLRKAAEAAANRLGEGLRRAAEYEEHAGKMMSTLQAAKSVPVLSPLLKTIERLPPLGCVQVNSPGAADLRERVLKRIEELVEEQCTQLERLTNITAFEHNEKQLEEIRSSVRMTGQQPLVDRVTAATANLRDARRELEAGQKDTDIRAKIEAMWGTKSLAQLRSYRQMLKSFHPHAESTKTRIEEAEKHIDDMIAESLSFVDGLSGQMDGVLSAQAAREVRDGIRLRQERYADTPELEQLEMAVERCDALEVFFQGLAQLQDADPADPAEAEKRLSELDALEKNTVASLSDDQRALISDCRELISGRVAKKKDDAVQWLERCDGRVAAGEVTIELLNELRRPPAFLPEDRKPGLVSLQQRAQARMDEDVVSTIKSRFRQIADKDKQEECLRELQRIVEEEP